jgi:hypothetical protein
MLNGTWDNGANIKMTKDEAASVHDCGTARPSALGLFVPVDGVKALDPATARRSATARDTTS